MSTEKEITLSILKAYNWREKEDTNHYQFCFYSSLSRALILRKMIKTHILNGQLMINTSLKITYTPQESSILLQMYRVGEDASKTFVEEFLVDLDLLADKKMQYLPFSNNDKILEVTTGHQSRALNHAKPVSHPGVDHFIHQKQVFLKTINSQSQTDSRGAAEKTFAQKLYELLQETKRLREKMKNQRSMQSAVRPSCFDDQLEIGGGFQSRKGEANEKLLLKSNSQNVLITRPATHNTRINQLRRESGRRSRCKLDLKRLTMYQANGKYCKDAIKEDSDQVVRSIQLGFDSFKSRQSDSSSLKLTHGQNH